MCFSDLDISLLDLHQILLPLAPMPIPHLQMLVPKVCPNQFFLACPLILDAIAPDPQPPPHAHAPSTSAGAQGVS
jgi:hypothetical protein